VDEMSQPTQNPQPEIDFDLDLFIEDENAFFARQESMEANMYAAMMKNGSYRVDYLNKAAMGAANAFGFYVTGGLQNNERYSHAVKHALMAGLLLIKQNCSEQFLVAVYMDVAEPDAPVRPAFAQMKADMRAGMFRRVFVTQIEHLAGSADDWWNFYRELPSCEVWTQTGNAMAELIPLTIFQTQPNSMARQPLCI
jgi:hypothetical protein